MIVELTEDQEERKRLMRAFQRVLENGSVLFATRYYSNWFNQIYFCFYDKKGLSRETKSQGITLDYGNNFKWKWKKYWRPKIVQ